MSHTIRKIRVIFATQFAQMVEYRAEVIIWMLSGTLSLIMMLVWMAQAEGSPGGQVNGYSPAEFASYFLSTWFVSQLIVVWVTYELDFDIRQGQLSPKLMRPLDPFWIHYLGHLSERLFRLLPMLGLVTVFAWLSGARFTSDWRVYPAVFALAFLGFTARFLWEYTVGLLAFWTESSNAFHELLWLAYAALGGMFAPLSFYPVWVQNIAVWTPFPYMLGLPAQLLAGKATLEQATRGVLVLLAWLVIFAALRLLVWRTGLKKYGAVGA
ncbi:ABC transporter permease [Deinococcus fonticola]|uniref:ABC transporter permease n=1 Tax=Deinococcus fonticola TaxID=2528713 RepID=UPI001075236A|nr:ABC-2 family transporter protein [Deinococcus fonticola]